MGREILRRRGRGLARVRAASGDIRASRWTALLKKMNLPLE
jgi:hypothetical protein